MAPRLVADDPGLRVAGDIDGEGEPVADRLAVPRPRPPAVSTSPTSSCSRRSAVSLNGGEPRRMRNCTRRDPVRTRMLNERGEISA